MGEENEHTTAVCRNSYTCIDPMVVRIARSAARMVIGRHGFTESDLPGTGTGLRRLESSGTA
ncbi:MAG: hypothetical protein PHV82_15655 [Victivallaceae bacterium]|nr:hypothetical protein [Victivallaceae bacterium]